MSIKNKSQLTADVNTFLPDNTTELISAKDERDRLIDIIDSTLNTTDFFTGASSQYVAGDGTLQSIPAVDLTPLWRIDGNTLSSRGIFGSISGAFGWNEVINNVVIGGVNNDTSRFFGTTASFVDTHYSYKSLGSTGSTYHTDFQNSSDVSLFSVNVQQEKI